MLVMDWALNQRSVLEDVAMCMSRCAPDVANGTCVKSGVSWAPDGVSLIHLIHQEPSPMVTCFSKLSTFLLHGLLLVVVLCVLIQHPPSASAHRLSLRLKNVLRARCTLWGAAPLGHYVGYQKSTVQGNSTKACIIAPKWVQTVLQIICTTLATIVPRLHPFHLSSFFN